MKFTLSWLKEHLDTSAGIAEIADKLTSIGLEVESVSDRAEELKPFTVAKIIEAEKHPNADKLRVCKVDNGNEVLQIVCGAANARAGIKVVLASVGAVIPGNGLVIKKSKIRDVESNGMLCSAEELKIDSEIDGIIELPEDAEVGKAFAPSLGLDDPVIEIAVTPNRADCLGVRGVARDLAAAGLGKLKEIKTQKINGNFKSPISVNIENTDKAPLFIGRHIKNVNNKNSPEWLKKRLTSIGLKPISALVDITNFLTFDLGRPAHVYDAAKLNGNVTVRDAKNGEKIKTLNEKEYTIDSDVLVIADEKNPVAIAGIIGGLESGCSKNTKDIFLEIALFNPLNVSKAGRRLQIDSDARYRFERAVDGGFAQDGAELATKLILDICGGEPSELVISGKVPSQEKIIDFIPSSVKRIAGIEILEKEIEGILSALGFGVKANDKSLHVKVPSWRSDVVIEEDLVEEIIRIYGLDKIPALNIRSDELPKPAMSLDQKKISDIRRVLASQGLREVVTFSFMDSKIAGLFGSQNNKIVNPISSDLDEMRPSIIPNLLSAVKKNNARSIANISLFEVGPIFENLIPGEGQKISASGVREGKNIQKNHYGDSRKVDCFDAKADVFAAIALYVNPENLQVTREVPGYYHPGKSGALLLGKNVVAYFGEMHPAILKQFDIDSPVAAFEIFIDKLPKPKAKKSSARPKLELSNLQPVERDFAFVVSGEVSAADILKAVRVAEKELIESVNIFDVYSGKNVEEGKKSIAFSVRLQPKNETLKDADIENISKKIIASVETSTGGKLRVA